jgi:hypothetical protein
MYYSKSMKAKDWFLLLLLRLLEAHLREDYGQKSARFGFP